MKCGTRIRFALCSLILVIIVGCGEDFSLFPETLDIENIKVGQSSIGAGETTTIEAAVSYSGDETALMYEWSADAGEVGGGAIATYIAPGASGAYFITLVVSDGAISDERTVQINVGQPAGGSLTLDVSTHWPAMDHKDKLTYRVNVKSITGGNVSLYYDITQDQDPFDAFLSIQIDETTVLSETAIGAEQPSTAKRADGEINVSHVINDTGWYTITFYIRPGDNERDGWLLNEAKLTGVQGTSDPQQ